MTKSQKFFSALGRFFKGFFTKNIILKIVVVLFAVLLWGFVITEENPEYTKRVYGREIEVLNKDWLKTRGWMLIAQSETSTDVDVKCEIGKHGLLDVHRVKNCSIDLSKISLPKNPDTDLFTAKLDVKCDVDSGFGTVTGQSVESVEVTIAKTKTITNQVVEVICSGEMPEGVRIETSQSVTIQSLTGQQSQINRIGKMKAEVNLSEFKSAEPGVYSRTYPVRFYEIGSKEPFSFVSTDRDSVTVDVEIRVYAYKTVPVIVPILTSEEFKARYNCSVEPVETYMIGIQSNKTETIANIKSIETEPVEPEMKPGQETRHLKLIVPEGTTLVDAPETATVFVTVSDIEEEREYNVPIDYSETKDGIHMRSSQRKTVRIRVSGSVTAMESFSENLLSVPIQISGYRQGTYRLPIKIEYNGDPSPFTFTPIDPEPDETDGIAYVTVILDADPQSDPSVDRPVTPATE